MREPDFVTWVADGKMCTQVSAQYKRELLIDYGQRYNLRTFVETGTCGGATIEALLPHFDKLYSIEIDYKLYEQGCDRLANHSSKVELFWGDSAEVLPKILYRIAEPVLFWLDAHYSGPGTGCGPHNPLMAEIEAIITQGKQGVVLVDDINFAKETILEHGILRITL